MAYLFLQVWSTQRERIRNDGQSDEIVIRHQLRCRECGEGIKQEFATSLELSDGEQMKTTVDFQSIASVPIATLLDQSSKCPA